MEITSSVILGIITLLGGLIGKAYIDPVKSKTEINAKDNVKLRKDLEGLEERMRAQETHSSTHDIKMDHLIDTVEKLCTKLDKFIERSKD